MSNILINYSSSRFRRQHSNPQQQQQQQQQQQEPQQQRFQFLLKETTDKNKVMKANGDDEVAKVDDELVVLEEAEVNAVEVEQRKDKKWMLTKWLKKAPNEANHRHLKRQKTNSSWV